MKEIQKEKHRISLETRNFEIELFWKRSLFFWGFIAATFVAFAELYTNKSSFSIIMANFGFICSLSWSLANRGSKFWQENWETKVTECENEITGELFSKIEEVQRHKFFMLRAQKYSVSKLAISLSDYTTLLWAGIIIFLLTKQGIISILDLSKVNATKIFTILTMIYAGYILVFTRTTEKEENTTVSTIANSNLKQGCDVSNQGQD